jgi:SAM-dependent methyltransferase
MRSRETCALCGSAERQGLFDVDGYPIAYCRSCTLVQVDVDLERRELEQIYDEDYFRGEVFHDYVGEREVRVAAAEEATQTLARMVPDGRLLDVGCAAGFFLKAASRVYDGTGIELSAFASEYARRELGLRVITGDVTDGALAGEHFDVITLWNTVEHMTNPLEALEAVARLSRPGSLLVLSTGDVSGRLARRNLREWNLMSPPYHLFFFSPRTIELLLAKTGFQLRRVIYDGVVATDGLLAGMAARRVATIAGVGNVMTVYAVRGDSAPASARRRLAARYRPLRFVLGVSGRGASRERAVPDLHSRRRRRPAARGAIAASFASRAESRKAQGVR